LETFVLLQSPQLDANPSDCYLPQDFVGEKRYRFKTGNVGRCLWGEKINITVLVFFPFFKVDEGPVPFCLYGKYLIKRR